MKLSKNFYSSACINNRPTFIRPVIPTIEYTSLVNTVISPKRASTKLNSNNPTKPQFRAPIMVNTRQTFCNVSIKQSFLSTVSMD